MHFAVLFPILALMVQPTVSSGPCADLCRSSVSSVAQADTLAPDVSNDQASSLANPSVGIGLSGIVDYASQLPFIDLMKSSRPWTGHVGADWGGMDYQALKQGGYLDEHGWPTAFPEGVTGIATLILTDLPAEASSVSGRYRLQYEGQGLVEIVSQGRKVEGRSGEAWFNAAPGLGQAVVLTIIRTDPNGTGDYLRNFTVVKEENIPLFEAGEIFNPAWIDRVKDMRVVRFMDWMSINNSLDSDWDERPQVDDFTYGDHGVPLEIMIRLANEIGADPWFNMPHLATDDYIRKFATQVRATLDAQLKAHVEFSNEVWNWQFSQAQWAEQNAFDRWGEKNKWVQFYALRASQMSAIWTEVFGDDANERLVRIISTQTGWIGLEQDILTTPMWAGEPNYETPPYEYFDAYAITGYFGGRLGNEDAGMVLDWLTESRALAVAKSDELDAGADYVAEHQYDFALTRAIEQLRNGAVNGDNSDTVQSLIDSTFPYHAAVAQKYDLDLIMYEGGTHIVGFGDWVNNEDLVDFFRTLNYSVGIAELYGEVMDGWKASGGTLFNVFVDVAPPSKWGSWGALRHLDDSNPRWNIIQTFNRLNEAWWEQRAPGTFNPTSD